MNETLKPGSQATCDLHPDRGVGTVTYVAKGKVFMYWGEFGKMQDREYEHCSVKHVKPVKRVRKRIPYVKKNTDVS